jgi:hypothetical protein
MFTRPVVTQGAPPAQATLAVLPQTARRLQLLHLPDVFGASLKPATFSIDAMTSAESLSDPLLYEQFEKPAIDSGWLELYSWVQRLCEAKLVPVRVSEVKETLTPGCIFRRLRL